VSGGVNALRGEAQFRVAGETYCLRPSFAALVAAEVELGPLFALVERAAEGGLTLDETARLIWHCMADRPASLAAEAVGEAVAEAGLVATTPILRTLLAQILQGR
jgi:Phage tail tube protein, GTA-gp10